MLIAPKSTLTKVDTNGISDAPLKGDNGQVLETLEGAPDYR